MLYMALRQTESRRRLSDGFGLHFLKIKLKKRFAKKLLTYAIKVLE